MIKSRLLSPQEISERLSECPEAVGYLATWALSRALSGKTSNRGDTDLLDSLNALLSYFESQEYEPEEECRDEYEEHA